MLNLQNITRENLNRLLQYKSQSESPLVSIFLDMETKGENIRQNHIRLKNQLEEIDQKYGVGKLEPEFREQWQRLESLVSDNEFWNHQRPGLALFLSAQGLEAYGAPNPFGEFHFVNDQFYIKPLFENLNYQGDHYVLDFGMNHTRLMRIDLYDFAEIDVPDLPSNIEEVEGHHDRNSNVQFHSTGNTGSGSMQFHGKNVPENYDEDRLREFLRAVNSALNEHFTEPTNLILSSTKKNNQVLSEIIDQQIVAGELVGNKSNLSAAELYKEAKPKLEEILEKKRKELMSEMHEWSGTDKGSLDLRELLKSAQLGKVEKVVLAKHDYVWGEFEENTLKAIVHTEKKDSSSELLDLLARKAYANSGQVLVLPQENLPKDAHAAGLYRYQT